MVKVEIPKEFPLLCKMDEDDIPAYVRKLIALELFREKKYPLERLQKLLDYQFGK
jgi:hypothetical protein